MKVRQGTKAERFIRERFRQDIRALERSEAAGRATQKEWRQVGGTA